MGSEKLGVRIRPEQDSVGAEIRARRAGARRASQAAGRARASPDDSESSSLPPSLPSSLPRVSFHLFSQFLLSIFCMKKETNLSIII